MGDYTHGYVPDLFQVLQNEGTKAVTNLGCPGETSTTFIKAGGCPYGFSPTGQPLSQLDVALAFLQHHPGKVSPVTLDIGANDILTPANFNPSTCSANNSGFDAALATLDTNLTDPILPALLNGLTVKGKVKGEILLMNYYDPLQNLCPNTVPYVPTLNQHLATDVSGFGFKVDVLTAFGGAAVPNTNLCTYTWFCPPEGLFDIHATSLGYQVIANTFAAAIPRIKAGDDQPATYRPERPPVPPEIYFGGITRGYLDRRKEPHMSSSHHLPRPAWRLGWFGLASALLLVAGLLFSFTPLQTAHADTTFTVSVCDKNNFTIAGTLDYELDLAQQTSGNSITFSCSGSILLDQTLDIRTTLTIDGSGQSVTLDGQRKRRDILVEPVGNLTLNALTITGGMVTNFGGGGLFNDNGGTLTLTNSTVTDNVAPLGGGLLNNSGGMVILTNSTVMGNTASFNGGGFDNFGTVTITNSTVANNSATFGGGGLYDAFGMMTLTNSTVTHNNSARDGGGLYNDGGTLILTNSTVMGNSAGSAGGGLLNFSGGTVTITKSTVANNTATLGGGGLENEGTMNILDSTVTGNSADAGGGLETDGTLSLTNSTVTKNSAIEGGGIDNSFASTLTLTNSTVAFNTASEKRGGGGLFTSSVGSTSSSGSIIAENAAEGSPNCLAAVSSGHPIADLGYNLESGTDCGFTSTGSLQNTDPKLASLADNGGPTQTLALLPGSPAIDAIPTSSGLCPTTDQRGVTRPDSHETACDMGAYEFVDNAVMLVNDLINLVNSFHLGGIQASFDAQLQAVLADLAHTTTPLIQSDLSNTTTKTACEDLHAFINHVQAQSGKHLTQAQAAELIAAARQIQEVLGC